MLKDTVYFKDAWQPVKSAVTPAFNIIPYASQAEMVIILIFKAITWH
ncbi:MAG: hypothetical protein WCR72_04530 [Bacteroidota bacterium]